MKIYQLYEQDPPEEMGAETEQEPTQVDPNQGRITSLEQFKAAVSDNTIQKVILYFNRQNLEGLGPDQIRTTVSRMMRHMGSQSPYTVFATYKGNASTYCNIRYPAWTRSWHQLANYFNIIAARYDKDPINLQGSDDEEMDSASPEQKASILKDAMIGLNDGAIIITTILSIADETEWEAVKEAFKQFVVSSERQLIPELQRQLSVGDKRRIDTHLASIGTEDRLLDEEESASLGEYNTTPTGYTQDQKLTTGPEIGEYFQKQNEGVGVFTADFVQWVNMRTGGDSDNPVRSRKDAYNRLVRDNVAEKFEEDGEVTVEYINDRIAIFLDAFLPAFRKYEASR